MKKTTTPSSSKFGKMATRSQSASRYRSCPSSRICFYHAIVIAACVLVVVGQARAEVKVPTIFSDKMVLQRDVPLPVWGQAAAGEKVTVSIGDASATTTADEKGAWAVKLPAMKCVPDQTGATMTIKGANTITVKDILIGEVSQIRIS